MKDFQDFELCCAVRPEINRNFNRYPKYTMPDNFKVAMSYVPYQKLGEIYSEETALLNGTLFPELDKPFMKGRCRYD